MNISERRHNLTLNILHTIINFERLNFENISHFVLEFLLLKIQTTAIIFRVTKERLTSYISLEQHKIKKFANILLNFVFSIKKLWLNSCPL